MHEEPALKQPRLLDRPAAAEEDDLGFLLELRRVYGTVVELPRRQTRQERLAKIIRRQKLTATTEDQQENTEVIVLALMRWRSLPTAQTD